MEEGIFACGWDMEAVSINQGLLAGAVCLGFGFGLGLGLGTAADGLFITGASRRLH